MDYTATTDANGAYYIPVSVNQVLSVYGINPNCYATVRPGGDSNRSVATMFDANKNSFRVIPNTEVTCRIIYKV
jgi:hypothetical protein